MSDAGATKVGVFSIKMENGGLLLERQEEGSIDRLMAVLAVRVTVPDKASENVPIQSLKNATGGSIEAIATWNEVELLLRLRYSYDVDGILGTLEVRNNGPDGQFRFSVSLQILGDADPDWLIPGLFYNENRPRDCELLFPGYSEIQRDASRFLSNHWTFRSDRAALPAVFCQTFRTAAYLSTDEFVNRGKNDKSGVGPTALGLRTADGMPELSVHAPFCEAPVKFSYCTEDGIAAEDSFFSMERSQSFKMPFSLGLSPGGQGAREKQYRTLYEQRWVHHPLKPKLSTMETERVAIEGVVRWHLDSERVMIHETPPPERLDRRIPATGDGQMHSGWLSGVFPAYVLLWHGRDVTNPEYVRSAIDVIDRICAETTPCGTIYPVFTATGDAEGIAGEGDSELAYSRTTAEAVLFLLRALRLELAANTPHPLWYNAAVSSLNFIIELQRTDGALPVCWDIRNGVVHDYEGSGGIAWIAALCAANHLFRSRAYLSTARRAAKYYASMVEEGFLHGSIEDQPHVPSCEDCHWAFLAYFMLYEADRDSRWLELAERAAELALTWRCAYNVHFPPVSMLGQADLQTRGADICSAAMPVLGSFGLISYGEMRKLAAYLNDDYFERRALEGRTFASQLLSRIDGEFNALRGMAVSHICNSDWLQPKSMVMETGHVMTNALVEHAELIERHLHIPREAMEGDRESVEEAASRTSIVPLERGLVLPESAASRRTQELLRRRAVDQPVEGPSRVDVAFVGHGRRPGKSQHTPRPISPDSERGRIKTPLTGRHTPLPEEYDPRSDKRMFDIGRAAEAAGGKRDNLLANLFGDTDEASSGSSQTPFPGAGRPRRRPQSSVHEEDTDRGRPGGRKRWNSEALEAMLEDAEESRRRDKESTHRPKGEAPASEEAEGEDIEIRWKIF